MRARLSQGRRNHFSGNSDFFSQVLQIRRNGQASGFRHEGPAEVTDPCPAGAVGACNVAVIAMLVCILPSEHLRRCQRQARVCSSRVATIAGAQHARSTSVQFATRVHTESTVKEGMAAPMPTRPSGQLPRAAGRSDYA